VAGFDPSKPSIARVYDYWLGGKENFAADREMAARLAAMYPPWVQACKDNRAFLSRAVAWAAGLGIGQFLDLGAGLPTVQNTHEAARAVIAGARVAYVDIDPVAAAHAGALLATTDGVVAAQADLADPDAVLADPAVASVIDPGEPACVILAMVLHFWSAPDARRVAAGYAARMAPGSVLVISSGRNDDAAMFERVRRMYTAATLHNHTRDEIASFFAGLDLVPPGVVPAHAWRGGMPSVPPGPPGAAYVLAGAGRKPG
jgi:SAM-dependent methyltransferase